MAYILNMNEPSAFNIEWCIYSFSEGLDASDNSAEAFHSYNGIFCTYTHQSQSCRGTA